MISASDSDSAGKVAETGGVDAAMNMPRSSAAVLTSDSTPEESESCAGNESQEGSEVSSYERDTGGCFDFGSDAIKTESTRECRRCSPQTIGYHGLPHLRYLGVERHRSACSDQQAPDQVVEESWTHPNRSFEHNAWFTRTSLGSMRNSLTGRFTGIRLTKLFRTVRDRYCARLS